MRIPRRIRDIRGLTSQEALLALADMALQVPKGQAIVELGVYQGQSLLSLAWGSSMGNHVQVYGIDPWELAEEPSEDISYLGKQFPEFTSAGNRRWAQWHTRSLGYSHLATIIQGFSHLEGQAWSGAAVGLLYVDGDHRYEAVVRDALSWAEHMAEGGRIVFDDYVSSQADVIRAVEELVTAGILEPVQIHAGRLAVTRLTGGWREARDIYLQGGVHAPEVTSTVDSRVGEEVPLPEHVVEVDEAHRLPEQDAEGDRRPGDGEHDPAWGGVELGPAPAGREPIVVTEEQSRAILLGTQSGRMIVHEGELEGVAAGADVEELTLEQMKALAKHRKITLGVRKDKKAETLQALREGE